MTNDEQAKLEKKIEVYAKLVSLGLMDTNQALMQLVPGWVDWVDERQMWLKLLGSEDE